EKTSAGRDHRGAFCDQAARAVDERLRQRGIGLLDDAFGRRSLDDMKSHRDAVTTKRLRVADIARRPREPRVQHQHTQEAVPVARRVRRGLHSLLDTMLRRSILQLSTMEVCVWLMPSNCPR